MRLIDYKKLEFAIVRLDNKTSDTVVFGVKGYGFYCDGRIYGLYKVGDLWELIDVESGVRVCSLQFKKRDNAYEWLCQQDGDGRYNYEVVKETIHNGNFWPYIDLCNQWREEHGYVLWSADIKNS